jgi:hypothetical protein
VADPAGRVRRFRAAAGSLLRPALHTETFDSDGSPIRVGALKLTARGRDPKPYQTPYGVVEVERYVYQTSRGGRIYS